MRLFFFGFALAGLLSAPAIASEMRYTPINPSFGGNAFNSSHLLSRASAQNKHKAPTTTTSDAETLQKTIQSSIINRTAFSIADRIFKPTPGSYGVRQVAFDGDTTRIEYLQKADGSVITYILDKTKGTEISFSGNQDTTSN